MLSRRMNRLGITTRNSRLSSAFSIRAIRYSVAVSPSASIGCSIVEREGAQYSQTGEPSNDTKAVGAGHIHVLSSTRTRW